MNGVESAYTAIEGQLVGPMQNAYSWLTAYFLQLFWMLILILDIKHKGISTRHLNTILQHPTLQPNWDPLKIIKTKDPSFKPIFDAFSSQSTCRAWDCKNTSKCPRNAFRKRRLAVVAPWGHSVTSSGILVMVEWVTRDWRSRDFATWGNERLIELSMPQPKNFTPKIGWTEIQSAKNRKKSESMLF